MKKDLFTYFSTFLVWYIFSFVQAQNIGEYIYPFENKKLNVAITFTEEDALQLNLVKAFESYHAIDFQLISKNESLASKNYTFQILYQHVPVEQIWLKVHFQKNTNKLLLVQSNLPSQEIWNNFYVEIENNIENNNVLLLDGEMLVLATKKKVEEEKSDKYVNQFLLKNGRFYENSLKYYNDTTAYVKVFLPDPLSSADQIYGGNYQDTYTKDTSALLIQNLNNSGGNTITTGATDYTFYGQNFDVVSESYINTFTTATIHQVFKNIFLDRQGTVLGYNATITDNLNTFTTQIIQEDYNYTALANEQVWKTIPADFSGGEFKLQNDFFVISEFSAPITNETSSLIDTLNFNRSQVQFEDVNTFFHLNNYKNHWINLGFTNLASDLVMVDCHGNNGADNSFFSPTSPPRIIFGQGGVDDAEDADVVIHEYGHAISNFASPNSNISAQRKALDEGFGDYLATSYSLQFSNFDWFKMFTWDGHNEYWAGRITNTSKTAQDINSNQNIYYNGEIWAATLMDLYYKIGADNTDKLAIEIMHYNMPNTTLGQAAVNLFTADTAIFNGLYSCDIFDILKARKFISGTCQNYVNGIKDYNKNKDGAILYNTSGFADNTGNLILEIKENNFKTAMYKIIDLNGAIVLNGNFTEKVIEFKNIQLSKGIYFLELETNNYLYSFKILKN